MTERTESPRRIVAVDWSGAERGAERKIWRADIVDGVLVALASGHDRAATTAWLGDLVRTARDASERVVIGLDFAFGVPAWYAAARGWTTAPAIWSALGTHTTAADLDALCDGTSPFWGRGVQRTKSPALREAPARALRETERAATGPTPFSVFQLMGAGAVGTGSLRGFALLRTLRDAGATIWPFDDDDGAQPVVCEIWPRLFATAARKSEAAVRRQVAHAAWEASALAGAMPAAVARDVERSDDAFDALVAACGMWRSRSALGRLPVAQRDVERIEGRIWRP